MSNRTHKKRPVPRRETQSAPLAARPKKKTCPEAMATSFVSFLKSHHDALIVGVIVAVIGGVTSAFIFYYLTKPPSIDSIQVLIAREAYLASAWPHNEKNLQDYGSLFADRAAVIDFQKPAMTWVDKAAIQNRLAPLRFDPYQHQIKLLQLTSPEKATAVTYTNFQQRNPESISGSGYESWQFLAVKESWWKRKSWKISSFTIDLPSAP